MNSNKNKHRQVIFLYFLIIVLLFGCSSTNKIKSSTPIQQVPLSDAMLVVAVRDEKFKNQSIGRQVGMQYGVMGVLIAELIDGTVKLNDKDRKRLYYDALGWLVTVDYKGRLAKALETELKPIDWINIATTETAWNMRTSWLKRRMDLLDLNSAILVKAKSRLPKDYRCLNLDAKATIYRLAGSLEKKHQMKLEHAVCQEPGLSAEVYLAKWVENNGALIKSEMKKGINELALRIKSDLLKDSVEILQNN